MGTLKLANIKYRTHLKDSIEYIFKDTKTNNGKYIFGDSGYTAEMVYDTFMNTKRIYDKTDGRQAYHYILTFAEDDKITADIAQNITEEVMKKFFPDDDYDWAGAVHCDTEHMHSHIIFNSVNRSTGLKYRYEKNDWEKEIQKKVDMVCEKYGLETIAYEKKEGKFVFKEKKNKASTNYTKYNEEIKNKTNLIKEDIDRCIAESNSFEEFIEQMKSDGYKLRSGNSKKHGEYMTFTPYGVEKGVRTYTLGSGYHVDDIRSRIKNNEQQREHINEEEYRRIVRVSEIPTITYRRYYAKQIYMIRRWKNKKPFDYSYLYKSAIIENQKIVDEYNLIKKVGIENIGDIENYKVELDENIKRMKEEKKELPADSDERKELQAKIKEYNFNINVTNRILERIEKINTEDALIIHSERKI